MGKARLLIVEDDFDIANMLRIYFTGLNYAVEIASRGSEALEKTRQNLPHLIVLDIMLPDFDGYAVCRALRKTTRTSHIPVIFLTQKDERRDRLQGLELGADDYITKPFDIEELKLRVQNAISRSERERLADPRTGLPSGQLIEEQLRKLIPQDGWGLIDARIQSFDPFKEVYGFVAGDEVLRFTGMLLGEIADALGTSEDFIGHAGGDHFIVITAEENVAAIVDRLRARFPDEVLSHYNYLDRQQGYLLTLDEQGNEARAPLMHIAVGVVTASQHRFTDIREITELAAEVRRAGQHP
jgi:PleD family two-component response regulator